MPAELAPPFLVLFLVALGAGGIELRNALRPPECPRCVHCRHEALARKQRAERDSRIRMPARWQAHDRDDDGGPGAS
jgi:hypothetical protein